MANTLFLRESTFINPSTRREPTRGTGGPTIPPADPNNIQGSVFEFGLDLSVARTNVQFDYSGDALAFLESYNAGSPSPNDLVSVTFNDPNVCGPISMRPFSEAVRFPFTKFWVTNLVIAGSTNARFQVWSTGRNEQT